MQKYHQIIEKVQKQIKNINILCVGDVMLDRYCYGSTDRISPEAPVPIVKILKEQEMLGGAGNVVRNIASLGGNIHLCSIIGEDHNASKIKSLCNNISKLSYELFPIKEVITTEKTRVIACRQQITRIDREKVHHLSETENELIFQHINKKLKNIDIIILSDYGKGCLNNDLNNKIISIAKKYKIKVIVDPKSSNYNAYAGANFITPNLLEFQATYQNKTINSNDLEQIAHEIINEYNLQGMLITQGKDGMALVDSETSKTYYINTEAKEVFDVSGAGDTVIAAFSIGLALKLTSLEAALFANLCAGVAVGKLGTATVYMNELQ